MGLSKKTTELMDMDKSVGIVVEGDGWVEVEMSIRGINGNEKIQ